MDIRDWALSIFQDFDTQASEGKTTIDSFQYREFNISQVVEGQVSFQQGALCSLQQVGWINILVADRIILSEGLREVWLVCYLVRVCPREKLTRAASPKFMVVNMTRRLL